MDGFVVLFQLLAFAYALSLGMGLITAQKRGARYVNRWWLRSLRGLTSGSLKLIGDLLLWASKQVR